MGFGQPVPRMVISFFLRYSSTSNWKHITTTSNKNALGVQNNSSKVRLVSYSLGAPGSSSALPHVHYKSSSQILAARPGPISSCVNAPLGSQTSYPMLVLLCWTQTADSCAMKHVSCRWQLVWAVIVLSSTSGYHSSISWMFPLTTRQTLFGSLPSVAATVSVSVSVGASHVVSSLPCAVSYIYALLKRRGCYFKTLIKAFSLRYLAQA